MLKRIQVTFICLLISLSALAQQPQKPNASEIYESIKKLNFLGSVLYVAAHPDDENTRLISYMANEVKARTAYLSLTRGDGGQNLIGPEIRELLGVIRTQELLTARQIDGGEQRFTRANDFGYSKHPDETLEIWNKNEVLSDVVLAIRQFQPDIIINRFDHRTPGSTHGHHTSSAMLSVEAFDLAPNKAQFPKSVNEFGTWQPKRLFFNTSWWFYGSQERFEKADKSNLIGFDIGTYYPSFGLSNTEIAALSRSQHKSQGFGNTGTRGSQMEYIELIKGDMPSDKTNLFEGIDTSWNRVKGGEAIGNLLKEVETNFDFKNPSASVPKLVEAYTMIQRLEDEHWKTVKTKEIKNIIGACSGLYLEAVAETNQATLNETVNLSLEVINRSDVPMSLVSYTNPNGLHVNKGISLNNNNILSLDETFNIASSTDKEIITTPYWLTKKGTLGMYNVTDESLIGKPETPDYFNVVFNLGINGITIPFTRPVVYKTNDPVKGEVYKPFEVIPEATVKIDEKVIIFNSDIVKEIPVIVRAGHNNLQASVELCVPENWNVHPKNEEISIKNKGEEQMVVFKVIPPKNQSEGFISPIVTIGNNQYSDELIELDYEHIPFQTVLMPSESKIVRLDIQKTGKNIAYIAGAGDVVPESLQQIGYHVATLNPSEITTENLSRFDAVVVGIRAYNTVEELKFKQEVLFDFVKNGGNMIVQYNTSRGTITDNIAPYKLELSRDRVTDEFAEVKFLEPNHPLLNYPNKITQKDFEGWTQERGLYFPDNWSKEFTPILSMHDKGESPKKGSLLVAQYGKGYYIYTGLSFFREFPAGVSGAYRLFANMLSIGKDTIEPNQSLKN
ncbi:LmbE family protein [Hanstruepera neustonica]|uniref:LmbE family protein n=1 Tax=Hanstruepera neustonica TaxID=1445657 RepID=A0A2K1DXS6_9FLAO|nr:PIG-L family deacetylase [Hanstruepera neustonica]PNQ72825.1 LmbE family protein [Hanstruepera neustonica]